VVIVVRVSDLERQVEMPVPSMMIQPAELFQENEATAAAAVELLLKGALKLMIQAGEILRRIPVPPKSPVSSRPVALVVCFRAAASELLVAALGRLC
jgi:hypothetical protein